MTAGSLLTYLRVDVGLHADLFFCRNVQQRHLRVVCVRARLTACVYVFVQVCVCVCVCVCVFVYVRTLALNRTASQLKILGRAIAAGALATACYRRGGPRYRVLHKTIPHCV